MSLLSLSSITPSISELRDSDLSDGYTIVLPKSITPSTTKISAQLSAGLDKAREFSASFDFDKAKRRFGEGGFSYKIGWDDELDRERKREGKGEREERRRSRSGSRSGERRRNGSKERIKKRRSSSQDTLSSLSDGPELDLSSYTRNLNLKRQSKPRSSAPARPPIKARMSKPVIPSRRSRSRESSVTSSSDEDEPVESTSESEVERIRESRARTPRGMRSYNIIK